MMKVYCEWLRKFDQIAAMVTGYDYWQAQEERFNNHSNRELWDKEEIQESIYKQGKFEERI